MIYQELYTVTPWVPCDCCDEYLCNIHMRHASECDCPSIDKWDETKWNPYDSIINAEILSWVSKNSYIHDKESL